MSTTGPPNPSSRKVAAAVPPALPPPTITIGLVPDPLDMRSFTLLAFVAKTAPAERCWSPMLRMEGTPGQVGGHRAIRAIRRPIPASAGSSPRSGDGGSTTPRRGPDEDSSRQLLRRVILQESRI